MISILYVDDEPAILDSCKKYLEHTGSFVVTTALSGKEALEKIRTSSFDAIIADYQMADINGLDLLKIIRNEFPGMPFIIFTGKGREDVVIDAFENGVDFYVQKGGEPRAQYTDLIHKLGRAVENHRIKERLERSEEKFSSFVQHFDGIAFRINPSGNFFLLEGTVEEITGYTKKDFTSGRVYLERLIHPDDRGRFFAEVHRLGTVPGAGADIVFRIVRRDGPVRWLHGIMRNSRTRDNTIVHIQGAFYDITFLHSTQEELILTEKKWRAIITRAPVIISVIDQNGRFLFINKARPPADPAGLAGTMAGRYLAPGSEHILTTGIQRVIATGEIFRFESEVPLGREVTEWLSHQVSPVTWNGAADAVLVVSTNITERKWLEQNLRTSEEQYRAIVTASGDAIVTIDREGHITFVSPRVYDIFRIPPEMPPEGLGVLAFVDPAFHQIALWRMQMILAGDLDADPHEYLLIAHDGTKFRGELVTTPLHDASGGINSLLVLIRDISRRKKTQDTADDILVP